MLEHVPASPRSDPSWGYVSLRCDQSGCVVSTWFQVPYTVSVQTVDYEEAIRRTVQKLGWSRDWIHPAGKNLQCPAHSQPGPQSGYMVAMQQEVDRASGHKRKLIEDRISSIDQELENLQERLYPLRSRLASSSLGGIFASQIASTPMLQTTRYGSAAPTPKSDYAQGMARGYFNGHPAGPFPGYRISTRLCP